MSSGLTNKIQLQLQNKERTTRDLHTDLERIASEQHIQRSRDNLSTLKFSHDFLDKYDTSQDLSTNSPNLLEMDDRSESPDLLDTNNFSANKTKDTDNLPDNQPTEIPENFHTNRTKWY
jgi:hypothetical protein